MMAWLLDTVTLSELRKKSKANPAVLAWQAACAGQKAYLSVITMNEVRYGRKLVEKRDPLFAARLSTWYQEILDAPALFQILPVDLTIAELAADFRAAHNTLYNDALIAATASVLGLTLATRNIADFAATGIQVLDPWLHA
jgi:predicted nucleic acid-binding protein